MGDGQREGDEIEMCVCTYKSLVKMEREREIESAAPLSLSIWEMGREMESK